MGGIRTPPVHLLCPPGGPSPSRLPVQEEGIKLGLVEKNFFFLLLENPIFFLTRCNPATVSCLSPSDPTPGLQQVGPAPEPGGGGGKCLAGSAPASCPCLTSGIACSGQGSEGVAAVRDR